MLDSLASIVFTLACLLTVVPGSWAQSESIKNELFDFGAVGIEDEWLHTFQFKNSSSEILEIKNVQLTPPLVATKMPVRVQPGDTGSITVRLEKPREKGEFRGSIVVNFRNEGARPLIFWAVGKIVPPIEFDPLPVFFVSTQRGQDKTESIEIINHEAEPFEILRAESASSRFTSAIETLETGRRYRLSLTLKGDSAAGRITDTITLVTSSRGHPFLEIRANTNLNERVHTFPDAINFGTISAHELKAAPQMVEALATSLMVYQEGGKDFQVSASIDIPFLKLSIFQAELKDRYEIRLAVVPEKLKSEAVNGTVVIVTNDPHFSRLTIPITAVIEGNW